jgi:glutaminyl-tRNA synthetase
MGVLKPLKVVIENYPEDREEYLEAINFPDDPPRMGSRQAPFSRELFIEEDDFMENPPKKFFRLAPGKEVRLRWAYFITCTGVVKDETGRVTEVRCTYDPQTRGGDSPDGRKVKGTIHWVSARHAFPASVRLYDRLLRIPRPNDDFLAALNPESLVEIPQAMLEPGLAQAQPGQRVQFERKGYFFVDPKDSQPGRPVFNRIVPLRDSWAKIAKDSNG